MLFAVDKWYSYKIKIQISTTRVQISNSHLIEKDLPVYLKVSDHDHKMPLLFDLKSIDIFNRGLSIISSTSFDFICISGACKLLKKDLHLHCNIQSM